MSSSLRFWAGGDICGSFRRPSRYLMSCQCVKKTGWPASEGVPGMVELPSRPWQAAHGSALRRPASTSAAAAGATTVARAAIRIVAPTSDPTVSALVGDAIDRARVVVGNQERAVLHLLRVHGPAPDVLTLEPPLREDFVFRHVTTAQRDHHHSEADLLGPVPRAALSEEGAVLVLGGEHRACIELDAIAGNVRARLEQRRRELRAGAPIAELGVEDVTLVAIGEAEV